MKRLLNDRIIFYCKTFYKLPQKRVKTDGLLLSSGVAFSAAKSQLFALSDEDDSFSLQPADIFANSPALCQSPDTPVLNIWKSNVETQGSIAVRILCVFSPEHLHIYHFNFSYFRT